LGALLALPSFLENRPYQAGNPSGDSGHDVFGLRRLDIIGNKPEKAYL